MTQIVYPLRAGEGQTRRASLNNWVGVSSQKNYKDIINKKLYVGSGCGSASNTRNPWFESNHRQILFTINWMESVHIEKTTIKKKEAGNGSLQNLKMLKTYPIEKVSWSNFKWYVLQTLWHFSHHKPVFSIFLLQVFNVNV